MKNRKIALLLCVVILAVVALSACSLFGGDEEPGAMPELKKRYYFSPGDYFVTNVKGSTKMSKTSVALLVSKESAMDTLAQNQDGVRNVIVKILREKTEDELFADNAIDTLETEMTAAMKTYLDNMEEFIQVEISDFVVQ